MKGLMGQCPQNFWARTAPATERKEAGPKKVGSSTGHLWYVFPTFGMGCTVSLIFRSTPLSQPNKAGLDVSVCPNEICCVGRGR